MTRPGRRPRNEGETKPLPPPADTTDVRLLLSLPGGVTGHLLRGKKRFILGRTDDCDIMIDDDSVSRRHASLDLTLPVPIVEDLGSRNGTVIQGRKLNKGERAPLPVGSAFEIGLVMAVLLRVTSDVAKAPSASGPVIADAGMRDLYAMLDVIAPSPLSVLVFGETGTGKEVFARTLHERSPRAAHPFLAVNCAALPETLLEGELFGHEKGAFTGATQSRAGLFETADRGSLLLDEVGELAPSTQAKLLRVLESGEITRLGSATPRLVDVRFMAATNSNLPSLVEKGRFRADLFYRLNGFHVTIPALRLRSADIVPLARHFAQHAAAHLSRAVPELSDEAIELLKQYSWPGNVRELRNVIERAVALSSGAPALRPEHFNLSEGVRPEPEAPPLNKTAPAPTMPPPALRESRGAFERERILDALRQTSGNQTEAARLLGIGRRTLLTKIEQYAIGRPRKPRG